MCRKTHARISCLECKIKIVVRPNAFYFYANPFSKTKQPPRKKKEGLKSYEKRLDSS